MTSTKSTVQVDNPEVRVTRWTLAVGEDTGEHRHEHDYVVVPLTAGVMHVTTSAGAQSTSELAPGVSYYRESGAQHNVRNAGTGFLDFVEVEILTPLQGPEKKA